MMRARISVEVKDRKQAAAIRRAVESADVRAFLVVVGTLEALPERSRARVLAFVSDILADEAHAAAQP